MIDPDPPHTIGSMSPPFLDEAEQSRETPAPGHPTETIEVIAAEDTWLLPKLFSNNHAHPSAALSNLGPSVHNLASYQIGAIFDIDSHSTAYFFGGNIRSPCLPC